MAGKRKVRGHTIRELRYAGGGVAEENGDIKV